MIRDIIGVCAWKSSSYGLGSRTAFFNHVEQVGANVVGIQVAGVARADVLDELEQFAQVGLDRSVAVSFDFRAFFDGLKQAFGYRFLPFGQQCYLTFLHVCSILDNKRR